MAASAPNYDHYLWLGALLVLIAGTRQMRAHMHDVRAHVASAKPTAAPVGPESTISQSALATLAAHPSLDIRIPAQRMLMRRYLSSPGAVAALVDAHGARDPAVREAAADVVTAATMLGLSTEAVRAATAGVGGAVPVLGDAMLVDHVEYGVSHDGVVWTAGPFSNGETVVEGVVERPVRRDEDDGEGLDLRNPQVVEILQAAASFQEGSAAEQGVADASSDGDDERPRNMAWYTWDPQAAREGVETPVGHALRRLPRLPSGLGLGTGTLARGGRRLGLSGSERMWRPSTLEEAAAGLWLGDVMVQRGGAGLGGLSPEEEELLRREGREAVERARRRGAVVIGTSRETGSLVWLDGRGSVGDIGAWDVD